MKVEFSLYGSEMKMAFELIPETDFEKTFCQRASKYGAFTTRKDVFHPLLMLETRLVVNPAICDNKTEG